MYRQFTASALNHNFTGLSCAVSTCDTGHRTPCRPLATRNVTTRPSGRRGEDPETGEDRPAFGQEELMAHGEDFRSVAADWRSRSFTAGGLAIRCGAPAPDSSPVSLPTGSVQSSADGHPERVLASRPPQRPALLLVAQLPSEQTRRALRISAREPGGRIYRPHSPFANTPPLPKDDGKNPGLFPVDRPETPRTGLRASRKRCYAPDEPRGRGPDPCAAYTGGGRGSGRRPSSSPALRRRLAVLQPRRTEGVHPPSWPSTYGPLGPPPRLPSRRSRWPGPTATTSPGRRRPVSRTRSGNSGTPSQPAPGASGHSTGRSAQGCRVSLKEHKPPLHGCGGNTVRVRSINRHPFRRVSTGYRQQ